MGVEVTVEARVIGGGRGERIIVILTLPLLEITNRARGSGAKTFSLLYPKLTRWDRLIALVFFLGR